jgi:hypothetical protein
METSENIKDLAAALAKAQGEVEGAVKGKANPAFRSKYADLASVWDACRAALSTNGLSVIQSPGELVEGKSMAMTTMLMHASGQWVRDRLTIPLGKVDAHGYGSATTYARRFALAAFVGVAPEDDDGNAAAKATPANGDAKSDSRITPALEGPDFWKCEGFGPSAHAAKKDGLGVLHDSMLEHIQTISDSAAMREWIDLNLPTIQRMPQSWRAILRQAVEEQSQGFGPSDSDRRAA